MRVDLRKDYRETVDTADRLLSADKILLVDLYHGDAEGISIDLEIMAKLIRRWLQQLASYKKALEEASKEVYDGLDT